MANAYINGTLMYGITLWATGHPNLLKKIDNLREDLIRNIYGRKTFNLSKKQVLNLFKWSPIHQTKELCEILKIHKTLFTLAPNKMYKQLTERRTLEQIKYKRINSRLRSQDTYNNIPYLIRYKEPSKFKVSYKTYLQNRKYTPKVVFSKSPPNYRLVWPDG